MLTPWGKSDYSRKLADGVYSVSTPGHGGYLVGRAVARRELSAEAQAIGEEFGSFLAFEEDCNWAAVAYEHPEWVAPEYSHRTESDVYTMALDCLRRWHPDYFGGE